jgi:hypothetical protein
VKKTIFALLTLLPFAAPMKMQAQFGCATNPDNTLTITNYAGPGGAVVIPTNINDLTVTVIGPDVFFSGASITSVSLPESITSIGNFAFANCTGLSAVAFPTNVTNIGMGAFEVSGLTSVNIPSAVKVIGAAAFTICDDLTNVVIGDGVTSIAAGLFENCTNLNSVVISGQVTIIGDNAFSQCSNLSTVTIPKGLNTIEDYAFRQCASLTNVTFSNGVSSIGNLAFEDCSRLTTLTIPSSVTNIGSNAFEGSGLTNLSILGSPSIGEYAFYQVPLVNVNIAGGAIGDFAYAFCFDLKSLTLGTGLGAIGGAAFYGDPISSIVVPGGVSIVGGNAFGDCGLTNVTISYGVSVISDYAFQGNPITSLSLPGSVTSVGDQAFFECSLTNVIIGAGVTSLVTGAFSGCGDLTNVFFLGNAPALSGNQDGPVFWYDLNVTVYYLPGTTGWSNTFGWNNGESGFPGAPTVLWNPVIETGDGSFGVQNGQFGFDIKGNLNIPLVVRVCTNLANPVWTPVQSMTVTNGDAYFSEPFQPNAPTRFYSLTFP